MANIVRDIAVNLGIATDSAGWRAAIGTVDRFNAVLTTFRIGAHLAGEALDFGLLGPIAEAEKIETLSQQTGLATDTIQELAFAAEQSNTSVETLTSGVRSLTKQAFAAANGGKEAQQAFNSLGVAFKGADGKARPVNDLLADAADRLSMVENDTERAALSMQLFGRAGLELQPFLSQGSAKIRELQEEAQSLGLVMGEDLVTAGARLKDSFGAIRAVIKSVGQAMAKGIIPHVQKAADGILAWVRANGALLRQGFERFAENIASFLVNTASGFVAVLRAIEPLAGPLLGIALAIFAILAPSTAVAILLALLFEDLYVWSQGGQSAIGDLIGPFEEWQGTIETLGTIWNFVKALFVTGFEVITGGLVVLGKTAAAIFAGITEVLTGKKSFLTVISEFLVTAVAHWVKQFEGFGEAVKIVLTESIAPFLKPIQAIVGFAKGESDPFGGAGSPLLAAGKAAADKISGGTVTTNQQNNVTVTVGGTVGATPTDIGNAIVRKFQEMNEEINRQAHAVFTPAGG